MARRRQVVKGLGIVELAEVCAAMRARNLHLFELLGGWVTTTPPGRRQRMFAEACHRHAWHAELWAQRAPRIPRVDLDAATTTTCDQPADVPPDRRADEYARLLDALIEDVDQLASRVDPTIDPGTVRTVTLVRADLTELRRRPN